MSDNKISGLRRVPVPKWDHRATKISEQHLIQLGERVKVGETWHTPRNRPKRPLYRYTVFVDGEKAGVIEAFEHESSASIGRLRRVLGYPVEWAWAVNSTLPSNYRLAFPSQGDAAFRVAEDYLAATKEHATPSGQSA